MNLSFETISNLRTLLASVDNLDARLSDLASQMQQAEAAASRLTAEIDALDRQRSESAPYRIQADQERLATLIEGTSVPLPDKKDIEAHAKRDQIIAAHRLQMADDLAAVRSHIGDLASSASYAQKARDASELTFLTALGEAGVEAYKAAALDFVRTHIVPLHSLGDLVAVKTGKLPDWWHSSVGRLSVTWAVPRTLPENMKMLMPAHEEITAWPRMNPFFGDKLLTGEPTKSPAVVEALIASIRDQSSDLGSALEEAVAIIDANLSAEEAAGQEVH